MTVTKDETVERHVRLNDSDANGDDPFPTGAGNDIFFGGAGSDRV